MSESQHISTYIERPAAEVYAYASNPANLPDWATGLGGAIEERDGRWFADSPMGEIELLIVPEAVQSTPHEAEKATQWLLSWAMPLSSLTSGMVALIRFRSQRSDFILHDKIGDATLAVHTGTAQFVRRDILTED